TACCGAAQLPHGMSQRPQWKNSSTTEWAHRRESGSANRTWESGLNAGSARTKHGFERGTARIAIQKLAEPVAGGSPAGADCAGVAVLPEAEGPHRSPCWPGGMSQARAGNAGGGHLGSGRYWSTASLDTSLTTNCGPSVARHSACDIPARRV